MNTISNRSQYNWIIVVGLVLFGVIAATMTLLYYGGGDGFLMPFYILFPFVAVISFIISPIMSLLQYQQYSMTLLALIMYIQYPVYGLYLIRGNKRGRLREAGVILFLVHCLLALVIVGIFVIL